MSARTQNSQAQRTTSLDSASVVSINFFVKKRDNTNSQAEIFYARVDECWRKEDKYRYLDSKQHYRKHRMAADNA